MSRFDSQLSTVGDRQHGLVTLDQLLELGVSERQRHHLVRSGRLRVVHPGVYRIGGADLGWIQRTHAACLSATGPHAASHRSAARLWELDGVRNVPVELTVQRGNRPAKRRGVIVHESTDLVAIDCTAISDVPVTTAVRTLIDLGSVVRPVVLETALDDAVRRKLVTLPDLQARFLELARRGRRGIGSIRPLLEARTGDAIGPGSPFESKMLRLIREGGLAEPVCQFEVRGPDWVHFLDFAWPEHLVALECDSLAYHFGRRRLQWDDTRQNRLVILGWIVLRFTWQDLVERPSRVLTQISHTLELAEKGAL
jgi:very-short-patch-repair endonuclease